MIISFPGKTLSSNTMHEMDNILPSTKWTFQEKKVGTPENKNALCFLPRRREGAKAVKEYRRVRIIGFKEFWTHFFINYFRRKIIVV